MAKPHTIDLTVGWGPWPDEPFLEYLAEHCRQRNLNLIVCKDHNVERIARASAAGRKHIGMHIDFDADNEDLKDPYTRLSYVAKDGGAFVVNEPDRSRQGLNKAVIHYQFQRAGIPVPYSIVVRNWEPTNFKLTLTERKKLGRPFIIKPARGYGKQGVARSNGGSVREIAKARRYDRGDDFLLQELIEPVWCGYHRAWFRVYNILGQIILCWWDNVTEHYDVVTLEQFQEFGLQRLCEIAHRIARVTHLNFFSTELAITGRNSKQRVVSIDYINEPIDVTLQSHSHCGVPDNIVRHIAERLADAAWRTKKNTDPVDELSVWFAA